MSEDDVRHGTNAGYIAGCRLDCCRAPHADYHRALRAKRYLRRVDRLYVPSLGTQRRIRALQALGWRLGDIDEALGHPFRSAYARNLLTQVSVHLDTATAVSEVYERLCMTPGPSATTKLRAFRGGWPPPLAWDDIDDPNEQPRGIPSPTRKESSELMVEDWHLLRRQGYTRALAAERMGISKKRLEKAIERQSRRMQEAS